MQELTIQQIKQFQHWLVDSVWNHFIAQDKPFAYNEDDKTCRLRTVDGRKCAIGIFIPDSDYHVKLEIYLVAAINIVIDRLFIRDKIPYNSATERGLMVTGNIINLLRKNTIITHLINTVINKNFKTTLFL